MKTYYVQVDQTEFRTLRVVAEDAEAARKFVDEADSEVRDAHEVHTEFGPQEVMHVEEVTEEVESVRQFDYTSTQTFCAECGAPETTPRGDMNPECPIHGTQLKEHLKAGEQPCKTCGEIYSIYGDGYKGDCPSCADKAYARENPNE